MARYTFTAFGLNGTLRQGLLSASLDYGEEWQANGLDGTVHETAHHRVRGAPRASLTVANLGLLSVLNDSTDAPLKALDGTAGLDLWAARGAANAPGYASAAVHRRIRMPRGVLFFRGVSWSAGQKAEMQLEALGFSSDGIAPPVDDTAQALPVQPDPDQGWVLTAVVVNGASLERVQSVEITCDPKAAHDWSYGLPFPTAVVAAGVNGYAEWRMTVRAGGHLDESGGTGACSATFTRLAHGGGLTTNTVTFTFNAEFSTRSEVSATTGEFASQTLVVRPRLQSATKPVTWTVA